MVQKEGQQVNQLQGHGLPRLNIGNIVSEGKVWSDLQILPKNHCSSSYLKVCSLALIKREHNTQCTTAYCVWSCIAAEWPGWFLYTNENTYNGDVSIRSGPQSNGSWRAGPMNDVFCNIFWAYLDAWCWMLQLQRSCGVHESTNQSCLCNTRRTYMISPRRICLCYAILVMLKRSLEGCWQVDFSHKLIFWVWH